MSARNYVAPSWDKIYDMLLELAVAIRASGFKADLIVGVSRGGWAPARVLSDLLENTRTASMKIEFYVGLEKTSSRPVVTQPVDENAYNKNVLVVDDVSDTGESMKVAIDHVYEKRAKAIKTATIYFKPHSKFKPDFFAESTSDWIIFPWERLEATKLLIQEAKEKNHGIENVRETLRRCSLSEAVIDSLLKLANGF